MILPIISHSVSGPIEITPCPYETLPEALDLLYRPTMNRRNRIRMMDEVLEGVNRGELDLSGMWVAVLKGQLLGVMLTQALAGRSAAIWPPVVASKSHIDRDGLAAELVAQALQDYRNRGFQIAQALLEPDAKVQHSLDLERGGLPPVTSLIYLSRLTEPPIELAHSRDRFIWRTFDEAGEDKFGNVLLETYQESLDMPELQGARSLDDVLAGHRSGFPFDAARWWIGELADCADSAAVVLLSPGLEHARPPTEPIDSRHRVIASSWELAYIGLTKTARGRGLGRVVLAHALKIARRNATSIRLAVDARNTPAIRLYQNCGFVPFDRRRVHLAVLVPRG
jgi:mycothiol synthase